MLESQPKEWLSLGVDVIVSGGCPHEWGVSLEEYFAHTLACASFFLAGCILLHLHDEEHSEYYYDDFTVCCGISSIGTQVTQSAVKVSYENTEMSTLNIEQCFLVLDMPKNIQTLFTILFECFFGRIFYFLPCERLGCQLI